MPATDRATDAIVARLLERLAKVADLTEAGSLVLDALGSELDVSCAVAALRTADGLRGVGFGVPAERVDAFLQAVEASESTAAALFATPAAGVPFQPGSFPELGFDAWVALAVPTERQDYPAVVLLDAAGDAGALEAGADLLRRCGPALGAAIELDGLRTRQRKLSSQRELLTTIVNALPDPVLLTNTQNESLLANRRADHLFTSTSDDSEGRRRAVQINTLLFSSFLTEVAIEAERAGGRELNLVDPTDGSDLLFEVLTLPLPGPIVGDGTTVSILRDITDLRRAVNELEAQFTRSRLAEHTARSERDRLNVVLENVLDPILVTDDKSNIVLMNKEADRLFVVPDGANTELPRWRAVQANDTVFTTMISDFLLQKKARRVERMWLTDPASGRSFPAEIFSSKISDQRGETTAIVSVLHDLTQVTENERLASELRQLNDELEERIRRATLELEERNRTLEWQSQELERASRLKSEFLANMSHELRTPINVVLGYTSLMRERIYGELTGQQEESLSKIYGTSQHLLELINDILDLSKIEAGKMPLHLEEVRLESLLEEVSQTIEPIVHRKSIVYRTRVATDLPVLVTDRTKLRQVLLNLISNAIKFTHTGSVTVEATATGERVHIDVADTGIGIRAEDIATIFEDFRQVDQSHTREYGGTGLGLSITKKLLGVLGGSVRVESTYGVGSRFSIELPIHATGDHDTAVTPRRHTLSGS